MSKQENITIFKYLYISRLGGKTSIWELRKQQIKVIHSFNVHCTFIARMYNVTPALLDLYRLKQSQTSKMPRAMTTIFTGIYGKTSIWQLRKQQRKVITRMYNVTKKWFSYIQTYRHTKIQTFLF